jgi:hypothetical protein
VDEAEAEVVETRDDAPVLATSNEDADGSDGTKALRLANVAVMVVFAAVMVVVNVGTASNATPKLGVTVGTIPPVVYARRYEISK